MYFDTHAHLDDPRYGDRLTSVLSDCLTGGVERVVNIGSDLPSSERSIRLAEANPWIYAAVGIHPSETTGLTEQDFARLKELAGHPRVCAIGEIGLDYHYEDTDKPAQAKAFRKQLALAQELNLPVVIHSRDATQDTLTILREFPQVTGILHSYSGSAETAKLLLKMGYYLSFNGILTFKNAHKTREVALSLPHDRVLIETDCPYLAPEPYRGTTNAPYRVACVAAKLAELWGISLEEAARITRENGKRAYRMKD